MKRGALRSALTDALQSGKLAVVDQLDVRGAEDQGGRRPAGGALRWRARCCSSCPSREDAVEKSFRNLPSVRIAYARSLGTYEVLRADRVLFTEAAVATLGVERGGGRVKSPRDVIIRPVVSEKSYAGLELNTYTFLVDPRANKTEIKEAVQTIWEVP